MKKSCVTACPVEWPDGRGISGRMRVEWVAGSPWNRWSDAHGMGGQMTVESAIYWMALAIQRMGAPHTAAFGNLGPVITVFVAWLLLGEAISAYQAAGLALVLLGVSRLRSKAPASVQSGGAGAAG